MPGLGYIYYLSEISRVEVYPIFPYILTKGVVVLETRALDSLFAGLTMKQGEYFDSPSSKTQIPHFIQAYNIKLDELLVPNLEEYHCFNEFFYRKLKPDARAIDPNPVY